MTKAPLAAYPALRMRRLRQADWIRRLTRETVLTPADLIWSMVVHEGEGQVPVASMPGISRFSVKDCAEAARAARSLGIPAIAVFPHIDGAKKDATGALAHDPDGVVARAVKAMKDAAPALVRWARAAPAPKALETPSRAIVSAAAPRYVGPPQAATGEASDAADLFGPVFADGQWPRPVLVRSEPCDPHDPTPQGDDCRRQLLLIGLATEAQPGSNPRP